MTELIAGFQAALWYVGFLAGIMALIPVFWIMSAISRKTNQWAERWAPTRKTRPMATKRQQ